MISLDRKTTVNGVWIFTDETKMKTGTIKFKLDGKECPDTNGVGVNAKGGVFNCGLWGSYFLIECTTACEPYMAIREIKLW